MKNIRTKKEKKELIIKGHAHFFNEIITTIRELIMMMNIIQNGDVKKS